MQNACPDQDSFNSGKMIVLTSDVDVVKPVVDQFKISIRDENLDESQNIINIAGINSYSSTTISGHKHTLDQFAAYVKEMHAENLKIIDLPVSIAGHCDLMKDAQIEYKKLLDKIDFKDPKIPIISCVDAQPKYTKDEVLDSLISAFTNTVDFKG